MVILVPTVAFVVTFLAAEPTTEGLRKCDDATVVLLFSSGAQDAVTIDWGREYDERAPVAGASR